MLYIFNIYLLGDKNPQNPLEYCVTDEKVLLSLLVLVFKQFVKLKSFYISVG